MADAELEARLKSHAKAFEGLMSLIPAKLCYGEDNSDQWQRKKQTKEQKRAAKKAKLDPAANKSALDVQNERKRKRQEEHASLEETSATEEQEKSAKTSKRPTEPSKKRKANDGTSAKPANAEDNEMIAEDEAARRQAHAEKRRAKRDRQKERLEKERQKRETRKEGRQKAKAAQEQSNDPSAESKPVTKSKSRKVQEEKKKAKGVKSKPTAKANGRGLANPPAAEEGLEDEDGFSDEDAMEINPAEMLALSDLKDVEDDDSDHGIIEDDDEAEQEDDDDVQAEKDVVPETENDEDQGAALDDEMAPLKFDGLVDEDASSSHASSADETPTFDLSHTSSVSSASSIQPELANLKSSLSDPPLEAHDNSDSGSADEDASDAKPREKLPKLPTVDPEILQSRLQARLAALRAARKADGLDGKPAKNRQELIEARRRKDEARKAHKKEQRLKSKQHELQEDAEAEAARLRGGSGSPMYSPGAFSPREENNFSFGRVAFEDGTQLDAGLGGVIPARKKKGPQDVKTALNAAQNKQARINGLDATKRADIEEKDRWMNARKRVQGEKIRDDTNLLKKTLKRKEKEKGKSEQEWNERIEGVAKGKEVRQKKRDENLRKRKEEKGGKGKKGSGGKAGGVKKPAVKRRPGFEGSFRSGGGKRS